MADADTDAEAEGDEPDGDEPEGGGATGDDLIARVAAHDEALAAEVDELEDRIETLEGELASREEEVADLEERLQRERADFRNYKKRAKQREERIRDRATEDLVERLLDVRDNLGRALDQEGDAGIREGIESTLETFDRILEDENVTRIEPTPGDEVDPNVHEVVMRAAGEQPEGTIERVFRPGYEMAGKVLRPAQVTVSEGDDGGGADGGGDPDEAVDGGGSGDADG